MNKNINFSKKIILQIKNVVGKNCAHLHQPSLVGNEKKYIVNSLNKNYVSSAGPDVERFEKKISKITGAKYSIAVSSGTAGLHLSLKALNINKKHEILIPALNYIASSNATIYCDAIPHFIDIEKKTLGVDCNKLEKYLLTNTFFKNKKTYNKNTKRLIKAIIPTHMFGHAVNMTELKKIAKRFNLRIIEDASEALGSYYKGKHLGTIGQIGVISFNGNKIITTGGGGIVITNNKVLANKVRHLSNVGKVYKKYETEHDIVAFNYKMPNINAVLGIAQLENLKKFVKFKRNLFIKYKKKLSKFTAIKVFEDTPDEKSNYWLQTLIINSKFKKIKKELFKYANKEGVAIRSAWTLMHKNKYLKRFPKMNLSNANKIQKLIINIPSSYFKK